MVKISVIMPVYNESLLEINKSINSILDQTFKNFELIIIDDNPYSMKLRKFLKRKNVCDNRIELIFNRHNKKLVRTENRGINYATGDIIARIDADDISDKNRLLLQVKFLLKNNLDCVCCNCSLFNENRILIRNFISDYSQYDQNKIKHVITRFNFAIGSTLMYKKKVFSVLKGYRLSYIDDYDFVTRALVHGFRVGYQSNVLIYKKQRSKSISSRNALKQFVGLKILSHYLCKFNFCKVVPKIVVRKKISQINKKQLLKFRLARYYFHLFRYKKSIISFIAMLFVIFSSKLICEYCLWSKFINNKKNMLLK